ncbi:hypothetical protein [Corynebacterium tapiri]|uniref:Uncharacterized protein n=1 Tax=Corynebacterium tapiri TaxID=1448266 RepID=A0A5C4U4M7_9CORY|nr:hypothetical protein [Corynebacterium tapiri]TNL98735.1 hypothetical protein FHE74_03685 [Corynebacterium tapiri]
MSQNSPSPADNARSLFARSFDSAASSVAQAPLTYVVSGEETDHYGGCVVVGLSEHHVAVAVGPGEGDRVDVVGVEDQAEVAERLTGLVASLVQRQLVPRTTSGLHVAISCPAEIGAGLGRDEAIDAACVVALVDDPAEADIVPHRARLSELCAQSAAAHAHRPHLRGRYTAILRGTPGNLSVIDYGDGSVTQVSAPTGYSAAVITGEHPSTSERDQEELQRRAFIDAACHAFAADPLRTLPDAHDRVLKHLAAVHDFDSSTDLPSVETAHGWLSRLEREIDRTQAAALALRSRRVAQLWPVLTEGAQDAPDNQVAQAAVRAGATAAIGLCTDVALAYVEVAQAQSWLADLTSYSVVWLGTGEPARRVSPED